MALLYKLSMPRSTHFVHKLNPAFGVIWSRRPGSAGPPGLGCRGFRGLGAERTSRAGPPELAVVHRKHSAPVLQAGSKVLVQHVVDRGVGHHDYGWQHALPEPLQQIDLLSAMRLLRIMPLMSWTSLCTRNTPMKHCKGTEMSSSS